MRAMMASECESAKFLYFRKEPESIISLHTKAAKAINFKLRDVFAKVDRYLAACYLLLKRPDYKFKDLGDNYAEHGGREFVVRELLPYYEKFDEAGRGQIKEYAKRIYDEYMAPRRDPERQAKFHRIDAYFRRKDRLSTRSRLERLNEYYNIAVEMNCTEDQLAAYRVFIEHCKREVEAKEKANAAKPVKDNETKHEGTHKNRTSLELELNFGS